MKKKPPVPLQVKKERIIRPILPYHGILPFSPRL
nr:MAG TPA: hypothetical protein [Caudoviricetes sp.]